MKPHVSGTCLFANPEPREPGEAEGLKTRHAFLALSPIGSSIPHLSITNGSHYLEPDYLTGQVLSEQRRKWRRQSTVTLTTHRVVLGPAAAASPETLQKRCPTPRLYILRNIDHAGDSHDQESLRSPATKCKTVISTEASDQCTLCPCSYGHVGTTFVERECDFESPRPCPLQGSEDEMPVA